MAGATFAPQTGRGPEVGPRAASAQLPSPSAYTSSMRRNMHRQVAV